MNVKKYIILFIVIFTLSLSGGNSWAKGLPGYGGSRACKECHQGIYVDWKLTPHARMLRDAKDDPRAIEAKYFTEDIPFTEDDIHYTLGSHWIQKYLTKIDDQHYTLPRYWNIADRKWEPYSIFNWRKKPYALYCNGCHTVGFDPETQTFVEETIGCECCHGPGKKHTESAEIEDIVNPAKLSKERQDMICEACHTDGKDLKTKKYPFAAGFQPGDHIDKYYTKFFLPKPRSISWYKGDSTYKDRHRMFLFYQSKMYSNVRACEVCGFDRGITGEKERFMSRSEYCGTCHHYTISNFETHSRHKLEKVECVDCHVPKVVASGERYSIHDHKFDFSQPKMPCDECHNPEDIAGAKEPENHNFNINEVKIKENLTLEEACQRCHQDEDISWVKENIKDIVTGWY